ncbi:C1 family peptidase [Rhodobacteraceae bacterium M382]|nr:C1 family peptidase [Rhodobacteraceae bacterium M382]
MGVSRDWVDLRDFYYSPNLGSLKSTCLPDPECIDPVTGPVFGLRDQGETGRCVGFAMANLIDYQRALQGDVPLGPTDQVSADMLYHMARFHEMNAARSTNGGRMAAEGVYSLRSAIKGFYHHGVCLDLPGECVVDQGARARRWQSLCYRFGTDLKEDVFPSVEQAKAAQQVSLGAYYRLRPVLNHYHAALNEAGVILVSANLTTGWRSPDGVIDFGAGVEPLNGSHAVVIVGYTQQGFLVLNSWGNWGGFNGMPGVALWRYADWAENVMDGWVLRLGVPTPEAFDLSVGEQGTSRIYGPTQSGSVPCRELLGHFLHLDDGHHVERGSYPSSDQMVAKTLDFLDGRLSGAVDAPKGYRGVVLWIAGNLDPMKAGFAASVRRKKWLKERGLFLITVFWCNDFFEQSMGVLERVFADSQSLVGEGSEHLDVIIENQARGIGRAFWRDIEHAAQRAIEGISEHPRNHVPPKHPGHVDHLINRLVEQAEMQGSELHLVCEGAGALVLAEWLEQPLVTETSRVQSSLPEDAAEMRIVAKARQITSAQLSLPAIDVPRAGETILPFLNALNAGRPNHAPQEIVLGGGQAALVADDLLPGRILIPDRDLEQTLRVGVYGKSILHLVANAFEDRRTTHPDAPPRAMLGMAGAPGEIASDPENNWPDFQTGMFTPIRMEISPGVGAVQQHELSRSPQLEAAILAATVQPQNSEH